MKRTEQTAQNVLNDQIESDSDSDWLEKVDCPYCNNKSHDLIDSDLEQMWNFIPLIVCINLKDRHDRFKHTQTEFHRVGLCSKVKYLFTQRPQNLTTKQAGTMGCWQSHQNASQKLLSHSPKTHKFALILEDDVVFDENIENIFQGLKKVKDFVLQSQNFDLFYLGAWSFWLKPKIDCGTLGASGASDDGKNKFSVRRTHSRCFHAYIINRKFARKLVDTDFEDQLEGVPQWIRKRGLPGFGVDTWAAYKSKNAYALFPMIAFQAPAPSSNDRALNKFFINYALSDPNVMKLNQYIVAFCSIFAHFLIWIFSPAYRRQTTI